jgi:membrane protein DedA with SNARE-associated domain
MRASRGFLIFGLIYVCIGYAVGWVAPDISDDERLPVTVCFIAVGLVALAIGAWLSRRFGR